MVQRVNKAKPLHEIFEEVALIDNVKDQAAKLKAYETTHLSWFINAMFNVDFHDLEIPDFKKQPYHVHDSVCVLNIQNSINRIKSAYHIRNTNPEKSKKNLTIVLEEVSGKEADLLVTLFQNRKVEGIPKAAYKKAYPQFFRNESEETSNEENSFKQDQKD